MKKYNIYKFLIYHPEYYPEETNVYLANDKDMKAIKNAGDDDLIYYYVDDDINLAEVKAGDMLELDEVFKVLATEEDNK